jgi:UDP-N-acetylmuramoyl-L-alanyl-D-glutamate--2,6-diaminopimelate ligase
VKIKIDSKEFKYLSDDTNEIDEVTLFLLTNQNKKYFDISSNIPYVTPKDAIALMGINENIKIIGITGTNGKTTTAACIYSILLDLDKSVGFQGTRGFFLNEKQVQSKSLTTPLVLGTLKNLQTASQEGCKYFVMEVSSHAIEQQRIEGLDFALKIFTNISQDHLDFHKNIDNYIAVKSRFFEDETPKLINKDDGKIRFNRKNCMTYGLENPSTYKVMAYSLKDGISGVVQKFDKMYEFSSPLHGLFNLYNITAAISAVDMLGISSMENICEAVENFAGVQGRMEVVSNKPLVIVDFAHTPDGMEKVLDALKDKDIIVVFGAGGDRDKTKRPKMGFIASKYAKEVIVTSDNPRSENPSLIIEDILTGIKDKKNLHVEADRRKAIKLALDMRKDEEIVVILGKGDETYQEIKGEKLPFDDRKIAKELLGLVN